MSGRVVVVLDESSSAQVVLECGDGHADRDVLRAAIRCLAHHLAQAL